MPFFEREISNLSETPDSDDMPFHRQCLQDSCDEGSNGLSVNGPRGAESLVDGVLPPLQLFCGESTVTQTSEKPQDTKAKEASDTSETPGALVESTGLADASKKFFEYKVDSDRFLKTVATFVERGRNLGQHDKPAQLAAMGELAKLIDPRKTSPLGHRERELLAINLAENLADPTTIKQGANHSCNLASLEVRTASLYPERYARLVTEVALTGSYRLKNGQQLNLVSDNLNRRNEGRGHASRIFQLTAANIGWQCESRYKTHINRDYHEASPGIGNIRYVLDRPKAWSGDTGERLMDYSGDKPKEIESPSADIVNDPHLHAKPSMRMRIADEIAGKSEPSSISRRSAEPGSVHVRDPEALHQLLRRLAVRMGRDGNLALPLNIAINTSKEPFNKEYKDGGPHGKHSVTIVSYDPANKLVSIVDTNGEAYHRMRPKAGEADRRVPIQQLFDAMLEK